MPRVLSVFLPTWATDLVIRTRRTNSSGAPHSRIAPPVLLFVMQHNVQTVARCCWKAVRAGVRPGMTLAHAQALLEGGECVIEPLDVLREGRALRKLAAWAIRYSPIVAPDPPDGLFIDITGTHRLFGSERRQMQRIGRALLQAGFQVRLASAATYGVAWAMARCADAPVTMVPDGKESATLASIHVAGLRIDAEAVAALQEVDIDRIVQLAELPRRDVAERFGAHVLLRLDQALGRAAEVIEPIRLRPVLRVEREFDGPTTQAEGVAITVRELLDRLVVLLQRREAGIRSMELALIRIDAPAEIAIITLSVASRNTRHLWKLLAPRLERMNLGFGVEAVIITVTRAARLPHKQGNSWPDGAEETDHHEALGELIDTLCGRIGDRRVLAARPVESHVPELAYRMLPMTAAMRQEAAVSGVAVAHRPSVLFPQPVPLEVATTNGWPTSMRRRGSTHAIVHCVGPERIALPWWGQSGEPQRGRDYFQMQDDRGRWWWAFRCIGTGAWHLHGRWA